jgi:dTDP-4-amino-4,6-dideoxygalactose transaminase
MKRLSKRMYLSPPHMGGKELGFVREAFQTNWIAPLGPHVDAFEREFAAYTGNGDALALSSGTAAMHLALRYLGVGRGDVVYCSTLTFVASVTPAVYLGASPVFIDCDETSWNMDPYLLERELQRAAGKRLPKAVIVVHLYGQSADMDAIIAICGRYRVPVVEDAAEALGTRYKGRHVGSFGTCAVYSFNGNKIITTSGGGMLTSRDPKLLTKCRYWATQARSPRPYYHHEDIGYNYRLSNVLAGIGRGQLALIEDRVAAKRRICEWYMHELGDLSGISFMPEPLWSRSNRWLTCVVFNPRVSGVSPVTVMNGLEALNIESRPLWKPMHRQPVFRSARCVGGSVADRLFRTGLCLPSGSAMTNDDVRLVSAAVKDIMRTARGGG